MKVCSRLTQVAVSVAVSLTMVACGAKPEQATGTGKASTAELSGGMPTAPKDAEFTIFCEAITGPDHIRRSVDYRQRVVAASKLNDFYVVHGENQSILYYGFYRTADDRPTSPDPAEGKRAKQDLRLIFALKDTAGGHPFANCLIVPLDAPDPASKPEWDLTNAAGYWSVEIASYTGSVERKKFAVDAVREARAMGVEAYFCHLPETSGVYVGAWPISAAKQVGVDKDGRPMFKPVDSTLVSTMERFPTHSLNGEERFMSLPQPGGGVERVPTPSFLVQIPRKPPNPFSDPPLVLAPGADARPLPKVSPTAPAQAQPAQQPSRSKPAQPVEPSGGGKLKSLGD